MQEYNLGMNSTTLFEQSIGQFIQQNWWVIAIIYIWSLFWKAIALWKSARTNQKVWFVVFLFVNTIGILEILYIFYFARQTGLPASISPKHEKK